jgi:hypothetical protein
MGSQHHNDVMLNKGAWQSSQFNPWPVMGVAIETDPDRADGKGYCVLWMGDAKDQSGTFNPDTASKEFQSCVPPAYAQSF